MKKTFFMILNLMLCLSLLYGVQSCGSKVAVKAEEKTETKELAKKVKLTDKDILEIKKNQSFGFNKQKIKRYADAIKYYNKTLELDKNLEIANKKIYYFIAFCYDQLQNKEKAKEYYLKYLEINPKHQRSLVNLEYIYCQENKLEDAISLNKKILDIDKENSAAMKKIANYYMQIANNIVEENGEDSEEAKENFLIARDWYDKYLEKQPQDQAVQKIATALTGKYDDADALKIKYEETLKNNPNDFKIMKKLAKIYKKENNNSKAKELFNKVYKNNPKDLTTIKALIALNKSNPSQYIKFNKEAIKADPKKDIYHTNLAEAYTSQKKFVAARSECKKALAKNKNNKNAYKVWARIYITSVSDNTEKITFQDQLVYTIAYGLLKKGGDVRYSNLMKKNGQTPSRSDIFTSNGIKRPKKKIYKWINPTWNEVSYIDEYLKNNK